LGELAQLRRAELEDQSADLWRALADPTRRRILDLLQDRPRTTGEVASHFTISRIAIMRHLEVLSAADLVTTRKRGRERWHYLNAVALRAVQERWSDPLALGFASGLLRLKARVEERGGGLDTTRPAVDVALDVAVAATPEAVFHALTEDPGGWWGHPFLTQRAVGLSLDPHLGGLFVERWEDGGSVIATVTGWEQGRHLELTGRFHLGVALGVASFDVAAGQGGAVIRFSFRAVGAVDKDVADAMTKGWDELIAVRLKKLVESGTRLGVAADPPNLESIRREKRDG
jgi:DNA-binding transcriptional ArsR family regulator/uncharacterized protein YndB with AHSA1/START domain